MYELCKQEILDFLEHTGESPRPPHWNHADELEDCRNRLRELLGRMDELATARRADHAEPAEPR